MFALVCCAVNRGFAFQSVAWSKSNLKLCALTTVYRQATDDEFVKVLHGVRVGVLTPAIMKALNSTIRRPPACAPGVV